MSVLLDCLFEQQKLFKTNCQEIDGQWYCAKFLSSLLGNHFLKHRIKNAWRVLKGKSFAVHFKTDE